MTVSRHVRRVTTIAARLALTISMALSIAAIAVAEESSESDKKAEKPKVGQYVLKVGGLNKKIYTELLKRWKRTDTDQRIYFAPEARGGRPAKSNDGDRYQWEVYVPESYDGSVPFGTVVYINSGPGGRLAHTWKPVFEKYNLIWILGYKAGNKVDPLFRHAMALEGLNQLRQRYKIDNDRVYLAGISGGGRAAGILMIMFADVFDGGWTICGINPLERGTDPKVLQTAKMRNRYVFMTGDTDYNREQILDVFDQYKERGFQQTEYIQVTDMGHGQPNKPTWVEQTVKYLDRPLTAAAEEAYLSAEDNYKRKKLARAIAGYKHAAARGGGEEFVDYAKERLTELRTTYKKEFKVVKDLIETGDLKLAQKRLLKFRRRWNGVTGEDLTALTATFKKYRKEGRPEKVASTEDDDADAAGGEQKSSVAMPSSKPFKDDAFTSQNSKLSEPAGLDRFKIEGGHQIIPGQGIQMFPGESTFVTSKAEYKYPIKIMTMLGAMEPAVRDATIRFGDVEFTWGAESNTKSSILFGDKRVDVPHYAWFPKLSVRSP